MSVMPLGNTKASKLSASQVQEIRRLYQGGGHSQGMLARAFSVSVVQIGRIVRGEVWQHLPTIAKPLSQGEIQASAERMFRLQEELRGQNKLQQVAQATIGQARDMLAELEQLPKAVKVEVTVPAIPPSPLDEE